MQTCVVSLISVEHFLSYVAIYFNFLSHMIIKPVILFSVFVTEEFSNNLVESICLLLVLYFFIF